MRKIALASIAVAMLAGPLLRLLVPKPRLVNIAGFSQLVLDESGRPLRLTLSDDEKFRLWTPLSDISPALVKATLLYEDRWFRYHPGVNPWSLGRAVTGMLIPGRARVGASTVTMQLARMSFGLHTRDLRGKLTQILRSLQIELHYSKDAILEAYLNLAPFGANIEGAGAAARIYFSKPVSELNASEASVLAVIPQSPARRSLDGAQTLPPDLEEARARLLERQSAESRPGYLTVRAHGRGDLPFEAPHFVEKVLASRRHLGVIRTTLDLDLQGLLEKHAEVFVERNRRIGIRNVSALLVDYRSMAVRALVGSASYGDGEIHGQVDGTSARRSPGSILKPFIYALGMDQGLIHPGSMMKDTPLSYAAYNPENFDREFAGPVKAAEALIRSRNVPAIALANRLAPPGLYGLLKRARIRGLKEESFYGLALVLGGVEVTMRDVARLYAMLARGGVLRPLREVAEEPEQIGERLLSPESAYLTLEMLAENPRAGAPGGEAWGAHPVTVQWKTGTSWGFRDAWAAGVIGQYVLVVWVGNFDGTSHPSFVGREAAGPLFFAIADALAATADFRAEPALPPRGARKVTVCSLSGQLPGPHCRRTESAWFVPGVSPIESCSIHREIEIDPSSGLRLCGRTGRGRREVFEFWPSDLLSLFRISGVARRTPPPFAEGCGDLEASGFDPEITSPQKGVVYTLRSDRLDEETIPFSAVTDADARKLHWFVDSRLVGESAAGDTFFWRAQPGEFMVRAIDDSGRSAMRAIKVQIAH